MADYITLLGYEQLQRAAHTMSSAADNMHSAASMMSDSVAAMNNIFLLELERILREDREARIADYERMHPR